MKKTFFAIFAVMVSVLSSCVQPYPYQPQPYYPQQIQRTVGLVRQQQALPQMGCQQGGGTVIVNGQRCVVVYLNGRKCVRIGGRIVLFERLRPNMPNQGIVGGYPQQQGYTGICPQQRYGNQGQGYWGYNPQPQFAGPAATGQLYYDALGHLSYNGQNLR